MKACKICDEILTEDNTKEYRIKNYIYKCNDCVNAEKKSQAKKYYKGSENSCSLDRIDSSKGYIRENSQVISLLANQMKSNATREELILFSEYMLENLQE